MSQNQPGVDPDNDFTRMIRSVKARNEGHVESTVMEGSGPLVRTAAMNAPPLSPEERAELDRKAMELGVMARPEGEDGPYASLEEAQTVGSPVQVPTVWHPGRVIGVMGAGGKSELLPRLPDFGEVGGIDLIRGVVYLDGMEFSMPEGDVAQYRLYVIRIAHAEITRRLEEAMTRFAPAATEEPDGGTNAGKDVSEVPSKRRHHRRKPAQA